MKIAVVLHPGSKKGPLLTEEVDLAGQKVYHVRVCEKPINGQANKALSALLADFFAVSSSSVSILSGERSRYKIVAID